MKRRVFLSGLLGAALLAGCGRDLPRLAALPGESVVLAFGDSVTYGTGASEGEDWPSRLADLTGWDIVNAGIPGDTALAGQHRLPALLEEYSPALVVVEIGLEEDLLHAQDAVERRADLVTHVREELPPR